MNLVITAHCQINARGVYKNGDMLYENKEGEPFSVFAKTVYQQLDPRYPKFFKMDDLCKLAFLAAEVLLSDSRLESEKEGADIALVLGNRSSSIISDLEHRQRYSNREHYFPSPAVFVYTLPNIMLGELCIRHQITGENSCFLMQEPQAEFLHHYVKGLFAEEGYNACVTGWVDFSPTEYQARLFLVRRAEAAVPVLQLFDQHFIPIGSV